MRKVSEAVKYAKSMCGKPDPGGPGHCQEFVRGCIGIGPTAPSAKAAAALVPKEYRNTKGFPHDIPAGAQVFFPDMSQYGHVVFSLGGGKVATNDYCGSGHICEAPADLPNWHGADHFKNHGGFWTFWVPPEPHFMPKG